MHGELTIEDVLAAAAPSAIRSVCATAA